AEMLAFGNKRLSANIERSQSLAGCEDMEQAFQVQTEFFESAVRQYLEQANHVMTIM
nr:phasin family protein [Desulfuromonadales bacterium]